MSITDHIISTGGEGTPSFHEGTTSSGTYPVKDLYLPNDVIVNKISGDGNHAYSGYSIVYTTDGWDTYDYVKINENTFTVTDGTTTTNTGTLGLFPSGVWAYEHCIYDMSDDGEILVTLRHNIVPSNFANGVNGQHNATLAKLRIYQFTGSTWDLKASSDLKADLSSAGRKDFSRYMDIKLSDDKTNLYIASRHSELNSGLIPTTTQTSVLWNYTLNYSGSELISVSKVYHHVHDAITNQQDVLPDLRFVDATGDTAFYMEVENPSGADISTGYDANVHPLFRATGPSPTVVNLNSDVFNPSIGVYDSGKMINYKASLDGDKALLNVEVLDGVTSVSSGTTSNQEIIRLDTGNLPVVIESDNRNLLLPNKIGNSGKTALLNISLGLSLEGNIPAGVMYQLVLNDTSPLDIGNITTDVLSFEDHKSYYSGLDIAKSANKMLVYAGPNTFHRSTSDNITVKNRSDVLFDKDFNYSSSNGDFPSLGLNQDYIDFTGINSDYTYSENPKGLTSYMRYGIAIL